jgi:hypothetical protein
LPPAEVAVHPSDQNDMHRLYLMCENIERFRAALIQTGIAVSAVEDEGWGLLAEVTLPGGGQIGVYQPRHQRPEAAGS